ncbi:conjugal transfer protein MobA [Dysgonomonas sp. 25]|uniref:conjugal transfer protein MobA n=1 Tax=Dysgonomonas sp. 25 TaxID=2302933 RepID=UPI0013D13DF9|nr:conjugal transfer protein MobA [Dysgonomonas sp. 25]NDV69953.1 hypothetical protein [Dysgonomonas sp. 25]
MKNNKTKSGRKPSDDPAIYRYVVRLNSIENEKFMSLYLKSGKKRKADFVKTMLLEKEITVITFNKSIFDYYTRLTDLHHQYRKIGINYNQVVKQINSNATEKRTKALLLQLEKMTFKLVVLSKQIFELTQEMNEKWLQK